MTETTKTKTQRTVARMIDMGNQSPTMHVDYQEVTIAEWDLAEFDKGNGFKITGERATGCEIITFWNYQVRSRRDNGIAHGVLEISLEHGKIDKVTYFDSEKKYFAADGFGKHNMSLTKAESLVRRWVGRALMRQRRLEEEAEVV